MIPHGREPRHSRWEDCPGAPDSQTAMLVHVKLMTFSAVRIWPGNGTYCTIQCCTVLHCTVMVVAGSCTVLYCTFSNRWWTIGYWWLQYCAVLLVTYSNNNSGYVLYSNNHNAFPDSSWRRNDVATSRKICVQTIN